MKEMLRESRLWGKEIVYSTYDVVSFSGISLLPFVLQNGERGNSGKTVTSAILTVSGILLFILLSCLLYWGGTDTERTLSGPSADGRSRPAGKCVLARFDVLWIDFYCTGFFCTGKLLPLRNRILDTVHLRSGKYWLPIVIYAFSFVRINDRGSQISTKCIWEHFCSGTGADPDLSAFPGTEREEKNSFCSGCFNGIYSELYRLCRNRTGKRMYPLAMGVDVSEGEYILTYVMPDLPRATGQGKEEEDGNQTLQVRGKSFEEIKSRYERSQENIWISDICRY